MTAIRTRAAHAMSTRIQTIAAEPTAEPAAAPPEPDLIERVFDRIVARSEAVTAALVAHPEIRAEASRNIELVELIVAYVIAEFDSLRPEVRAEFAGDAGYIAKRTAAERAQLAADVLALFNGRNASEVGRRLNISRATVYRVIKQPRRP